MERNSSYSMSACSQLLYAIAYLLHTNSFLSTFSTDTCSYECLHILQILIAIKPVLFDTTLAMEAVFHVEMEQFYREKNVNIRYPAYESVFFYQQKRSEEH